MKKIKKIFVTPFFLIWVLIPALLADDFNIQDILFPSFIKADEFSSDSAFNDALIPFVNLSGRQELNKTSTSVPISQKVFFDEDSPSLAISLGTVKISAKLDHSTIKDLSASVINYSAIYLLNGSLII